MRALLDVNVLIALLDAAHVHHHLATRWLAQEIEQGWASCPITQNGCLRIMSQPVYPGALPVNQVAERLREATLDASHQFWSANVNLLQDQRIRWSHILGHRQLADVYLLALAVEHRGRFVTFDGRITTDAVDGANADRLVVIRPE
ncbi:MAG: TA system VapC family ribonuclease toxin [Gammaproteobacteria bacterium]